MRLVVVVVLWSLFQIPAYAANQCEQQRCVAIVDVGSSGSRVHIFSYDLDNTNTPYAITEQWSKKVKPGFSTIDPKREIIDAYLTNLFSDAPINDIPVYFYATAGMRLLPQPTQQHYYSLVRDWFDAQSHWKLISAKTIPGSEEGMYGWLSVNYELGTLQNGSSPVGVLDMGGASVEISFPVQNINETSPADFRELDVYGKHFQIFTHSFLGLGQNEITHQFLDSSSCNISSYELPTGEKADGDAYLCEGQVASLVNAVHAVNTTVQPVIKANPVAKWFVLGAGVVDLVSNKPFHLPNQEYSSQELLDQANSEICHQQWSTLNSQYPTREFLYGFCLYPSYYYALMVDGYGLSPQEPLNYLSNDKSPDWSQGAVIAQGKLLQPN